LTWKLFDLHRTRRHANRPRGGNCQAMSGSSSACAAPCARSESPPSAPKPLGLSVEITFLLGTVAFRASATNDGKGSQICLNAYGSQRVERSIPGQQRCAGVQGLGGGRGLCNASAVQRLWVGGAGSERMSRTSRAQERYSSANTLRSWRSTAAAGMKRRSRPMSFACEPTGLRNR
jgi:hypothetical protein